MLKEAEENAVFDKAKKGVINITYEFDNLLSKLEILLSKNISVDPLLSKSLVANLNQIKRLYNSKQLTKIETQKYLNQLNYTLSVFTFDFLIKELQKNSQSTPKGSQKGVVIDVTEE
jgi:sugar-specific transcriptional regulator TrmB